MTSTASYTTAQLKRTLAKLAHNKVHRCPCSNSECSDMYWNSTDEIVRDSELLLLCNKLENSLPVSERDNWLQTLYGQCEKLQRMAPIWYLVATADWETRTITLARVLKLKIENSSDK